VRERFPISDHTSFPFFLRLPFTASRLTMTCKFDRSKSLAIVPRKFFLSHSFVHYSFGPGSSRPTISLFGEAVSDKALLAVVPDTTNPDPFAVGTVYPFGSTTSNPSDSDSELIDLTLDGVVAQVAVRLDGYCTRTGTPDNTVEGYCHFTYTIDDPSSFTTLGSFVAEGPMTNPNVMEFGPCASLQVTGGTGILTAAIGLVGFCPSILNNDFSPPLVESLPLGDDLFEDVDLYLHLIDMSLDEEFVNAVAVA
jgi:hypothetical protein